MSSHFNRTIGASVVVLMLAIATSSPLVAQFPDEPSEGNESAQAAYFALSNTPLGGVPSVISRALLARPARMSFRTHAGFTDEEGELSRRLLALGLDIPVASGSVGLSAGISDFVCDFSEFEAFGFGGDCGSMYTAATTLTVPLISSAKGANGHLVLGFDAGLAYATGNDILKLTFSDFGGSQTITADGQGLAASMGIPIAFVSRGGGIAFAPHLAPRVGYGRATQTVTSTDDTGNSTTDKATESGAIFMLGGGVSVEFERSGVAVDLGFQKSFVKDTNMTIGIGFSFAPSR